MDAVVAGDNEVVQLLVDGGVDVNFPSTNTFQNMKALHFALEYSKKSWKHRQIAEILIEAGADVNAFAEFDYAPLHFAAKYSIQSIPSLMFKGANADAKTVIVLVFFRTRGVDAQPPVYVWDGFL